MSKFVFNDWTSRIYDDPRIGLVLPGEVVELGTTPPADGKWSPAATTNVAVTVDSDANSHNDASESDAPEASQPAGNRGFQAPDLSEETSVARQTDEP